MNTRQELLTVINQLPDERLSALLELAHSLKGTESGTIDRRAFLKLPPEQRDQLLAQQVDQIAAYFQPGTEEMEWVEDYVEDDDWDDEL